MFFHRRMTKGSRAGNYSGGAHSTILKDGVASISKHGMRLSSMSQQRMAARVVSNPSHLRKAGLSLYWFVIQSVMDGLCKRLEYGDVLVIGCYCKFLLPVYT
ncbi:hypothetical protein Tco_1571091 [Tanacetum coccineum]